MRHLFLLTVMVLWGGLSSSAAAQNNSARADAGWLEQVSGFLDRQHQYPGFETDRAFADWVLPLERRFTGSHKASNTYRLEAGESYLIVGACDADCTDLDLQAFDSSGASVAIDRAIDDHPVLRITPITTDDFRVDVWWVSCRAPPCYAGVRALRRTGAGVSIAGVVSAQEQPAPAEGVLWGNEQVREYAQRYGPYGPKHDDPFVPAPAVPAPAERIIIEAPVYRDNPNAPDGAFWSYDVSRQELTVRIRDNEALDRWPADVRGLVQLQPRQYVAMRGWSVNGSQLGEEILDVSGGRSSYVRQRILFGFGEVATTTPPTRWPLRTYTHTWPIEAEAARTLAESLGFQVVGVTKPWTGTEYVICGGESRFRYCFITGEIKSYRLIDKRDGSIIREWDVSRASLR
ncbi:MAG: hypothetical protein ACI9YM_000190 [Brevundimonas sp.]|jgi:hypothetical protein|uniref:hypothetical protein n=1 Tax=Brevundimonas sp. TaxID=1871086 RepID=UPI0039E32606